MIFRAAPNYFRFRFVMWIVSQISAVLGLLVGLAFIQRLLAWEDAPEFVATLAIIGEVLAWLTWLIQIPFSWMVMRLDYELRWYIVSDRSLRIREGILRVREKTMAFANIQNIAIRQGPLQRLLGVADVEVRNAGGGGSAESSSKGKSHAEPMHVGYFRGVANANEIRDILREGVKSQRDAGLGDPDESHDDKASGADPLVPARQILEDLKAARRAIQPGPELSTERL